MSDVRHLHNVRFERLQGRTRPPAQLQLGCLPPENDCVLLPKPLRHRVLKENLVVVVVAALVREDTVGDGEKVLAVSPAERGTEN
jgi:hypothetical protein